MSIQTERVIILAAVDASPAAPYVIKAAAWLTTPAVDLHIVHVIATPVGTDLTKQLEEGRAILEAATFALPNDISPIFHLAAGSAITEILQVAANLEADLLVLGTQELTAFERVFLGSVVEPVVRRAQCPVFVVRHKDYERKHVAEIDPPCTDCLATQRTSRGMQLWCARHNERHIHGRLHYTLPDSFGAGSSFLRPDVG